MSYVITTKIKGEQVPVGYFNTQKEVLDFENFAFHESSFDFELHEVKDFSGKRKPEDILADLDEKFNCWNQPRTIDTFEGYKRGE